MNSGFQLSDSRSFLVELGFWIPIVSGIPDSNSWIPDSTSKNFPDSGFLFRKFTRFRNPDSLTWGELSLLLWNVNLLIRACVLRFVKLSGTDLLPINLALSLAIFISIITSIIFWCPRSPKRCSIVQRTLLDGCSGCRFRFSISVGSTNTICEKNNEACYYFFSYWITASPSSLLASKIFTLRKYGKLSADHHARLCASCENIVSRSQTSSKWKT